MNPKTISEMTVEEIFEAVDSGMAEVSCRLESGELDGSGRYYTDEELAARRTSGKVRLPTSPKEQTTSD
jgi:hypothetical protein